MKISKVLDADGDFDGKYQFDFPWHPGKPQYLYSWEYEIENFSPDELIWYLFEKIEQLTKEVQAHKAEYHQLVLHHHNRAINLAAAHKKIRDLTEKKESQCI